MTATSTLGTGLEVPIAWKSRSTLARGQQVPLGTPAVSASPSSSPRTMDEEGRVPERVSTPRGDSPGARSTGGLFNQCPSSSDGVLPPPPSSGARPRSSGSPSGYRVSLLRAVEGGCLAALLDWQDNGTGERSGSEENLERTDAAAASGEPRQSDGRHRTNVHGRRGGTSGSRGSPSSSVGGDDDDDFGHSPYGGESGYGGAEAALASAADTVSSTKSFPTSLKSLMTLFIFLVACYACVALPEPAAAHEQSNRRGSETAEDVLDPPGTTRVSRRTRKDSDLDEVAALGGSTPAAGRSGSHDRGIVGGGFDVHSSAGLRLEEFVRRRGGDRPIRRILIANNGMAAAKAIMSMRTWAYFNFGDEGVLEFVAMASPEDLHANAEFVRMADLVVTVPGGSNKNNYANVDLIVDIAQKKQVDAVWPGWGHASENPKLPASLVRAGISFIGPSSPVMAALGDKIAANILAQTAGVPSIPWSGDGLSASLTAGESISKEVFDAATVHSEGDCLKQARRIGYPVMIKASEGGGGKGIRIAHNDTDVSSALRQVQSEVEGSPVFLMQVCSQARHIEVQILGDRHGNAAALSGRDCTTQRRFQKIFEEGPPVIVPERTFQQMERAAQRLTQSIAYEGAGTVEFLYSVSDDKFYFLELNPRLQVEHPVTELITGINLPAAQLQVAMGIPLHKIPEVRTFFNRQLSEDPSNEDGIDFSREDHAALSQHVIAARITAENPDDGFKPTSGTVDRISFQSSPNVWGYFSIGGSGGVHEFADSQIGHIFASGPNREDARKALVLALKRLNVRGVVRTTVEYLIELLQTNAFVENTIDTSWLDGILKRQLEKKGQHAAPTGGPGLPPPSAEEGVSRSGVITPPTDVSEENKMRAPRRMRRSSSGPAESEINRHDSGEGMELIRGSTAENFRTGSSSRKQAFVSRDVVVAGAVFRGKRLMEDNGAYLLESLQRGRTHLPDLSKWSSQRVELCWSGFKFNFLVERIGPDWLRLTLNGKSFEVRVREQLDGTILASWDGTRHVVHGVEEPMGLRLVLDGSTKILPNMHDPSELRSDVYGKLIRFVAPDGAVLRKGDAYCEVEAMKMVMVLQTTAGGKISHRLPPGALVAAGDIIATLDLTASDGNDTPVRLVPYSKRLNVAETEEETLPADAVDDLHQLAVSRLRLAALGFSHPIKRAVQTLLTVKPLKATPESVEQIVGTILSQFSQIERLFAGRTSDEVIFDVVKNPDIAANLLLPFTFASATGENSLSLIFSHALSSHLETMRPVLQLYFAHHHLAERTLLIKMLLENLERLPYSTIHRSLPPEVEPALVDLAGLHGDGVAVRREHAEAALAASRSITEARRPPHHNEIERVRNILENAAASLHRGNSATPSAAGIAGSPSMLNRHAVESSSAAAAARRMSESAHLVLSPPPEASGEAVDIASVPVELLPSLFWDSNGYIRNMAKETYIRRVYALHEVENMRTLSAGGEAFGAVSWDFFVRDVPREQAACSRGLMVTMIDADVMKEDSNVSAIRQLISRLDSGLCGGVADDDTSDHPAVASALQRLPSQSAADGPRPNSVHFVLARQRSSSVTPGEIVKAIGRQFSQSMKDALFASRVDTVHVSIVQDSRLPHSFVFKSTNNFQEDDMSRDMAPTIARQLEIPALMADHRQGIQRLDNNRDALRQVYLVSPQQPDAYQRSSPAQPMAVYLRAVLPRQDYLMASQAALTADFLDLIANLRRAMADSRVPATAAGRIFVHFINPLAPPDWMLPPRVVEALRSASQETTTCPAGGATPAALDPEDEESTWMALIHEVEKLFDGTLMDLREQHSATLLQLGVDIIEIKFRIPLGPNPKTSRMPIRLTASTEHGGGWLSRQAAVVEVPNPVDGSLHRTFPLEDTTTSAADEAATPGGLDNSARRSLWTIPGSPSQADAQLHRQSSIAVRNQIAARRAAARAVGSTYIYDYLGLLSWEVQRLWVHYLKRPDTSTPSSTGQPLVAGDRILSLASMQGVAEGGVDRPGLKFSTSSLSGSQNAGTAGNGYGGFSSQQTSSAGRQNSHEEFIELTDLMKVEMLRLPRRVRSYEERDSVQLDIVSDWKVGENSIGMVAFLLTVKTPEYPTGRQLVLIGNDITHQGGSFGVEEDILYQKAAEFARSRGIPQIYISSNSGARLGLFEKLKCKVQVQFKNPEDPNEGLDYLYLTPEGLASLPEGSVKTTETQTESGETRHIITDIIGAEDDLLGVENLRGSGLMVGETSRSYEEVFTISYVSGRSVGVGAYIVRLGQRVIQNANAPIILTGFQALNKLLGREVFVSQDQLGGPRIMHPNGVSHLVVVNDKEGMAEILRWLSYVPDSVFSTQLPILRPPHITLQPRMADGNPMAAFTALDHPEREVAIYPPPTMASFDPRNLFTGAAATAGDVELGTAQTVGEWLSGFFDQDSFTEYLGGWGKTVIVGRARLGGLPVGVVGVETRTVEARIPPDPADPESRETVLSQAGQVWYPDSAHKAAQAIEDFNHGEKLPLFVFANWRGFSGGTRDMYGEVLKFGALIVGALRKFKQPAFVYLGPRTELRGGAWVVVDPLINSRSIEMYADPTSRGGVLEASGVVEIKFRERDQKTMMHRVDQQLRALDAALTDAVTNHQDDVRKSELQAAIHKRETELAPIYHQIALTYADMHDRSGRLVAKKAIRDVVPWKSARRYFYWRLRRRLAEDPVIDFVIDAGATKEDAENSLRSVYEEQGIHFGDDKAVAIFLAGPAGHLAVKQVRSLWRVDGAKQKVLTALDGLSKDELQTLLSQLTTAT